MFKTSQKLIGAAVLSAALAAAGCATNEEQQGMMNDTMRTAESAAADAEAARASAAEARQLAQEALETARRALELAQANRERIDRMFRETMQK